jgi:hypothetical protein
MAEMGDTAIEYALHAADIAYHTHAFSPRSERMRLGVVKALYEVVKEHYNSRLEWDDFWRVVVQEIKRKQEKAKSEQTLLAPRPEGVVYFYERSIEDLFDVNRQDTPHSS